MSWFFIVLRFGLVLFAAFISFLLIAAFGLVSLPLSDFTLLLYGATAILLACVAGLQLYLLQQLRSATQADVFLKNLLQADPLSAIMTDGSGCVTWSNAAAHAFFKREIQSGVSVALLFENVVIDADSSVARLLR